MKNTQSPINIGKSPQPVANTDYSHIYDEIKAQEDMKAKDHRELPYVINYFDQILGNMVTQVDEMMLALQKAQFQEEFKDKIVTAQVEKLQKIKETIIDLNASIYDLKL